MAIDTDLSVTPYFDDYDATKQYYRVLFKPSVAVQARELNQLQSILQNQIESFGQNIYKEGSVIKGCSFTFDNNYQFVKLLDNYANGTLLNVNSLNGLNVRNPTSNLQAVVVETVSGLVASSPALNTIYVKYLNSGTYSNGVQQSTFSPNDLLVFSDGGTDVANVYVANLDIVSIGNVTGAGYSFSVTDGIVFKKGTFIYVTGQSLIVNNYNNTPDGVSVGFEAEETLVTSDQDESLLDNALGSPNFTAPGADRLKMIPTLVTREANNTANSASFYSLVDFVEGLPVTINQTTQFNSVAIEAARRTYETNGNYVVSPFIVSSKTLANSSDPEYATHYNLTVSRGLGYVNGYRVEYLNNNLVRARRGTDTANADQQRVSLNFGYYVLANEFSGNFGDSKSIVQVELHSVAKQSQTNRSWLSTSYSSSTKIGTAYVRGCVFDNGYQGQASAQYRIYLFNISMSPGYSFNNVRSIIYDNGSLAGIADVSLTYNAAAAANVAVLYSPAQASMLYQTGQKSINHTGFDNTSFNYRKLSNTQVLTSGYANVVIASAVGSGSETYYYTGTLSSSQKDDFVVIPTSNGYSTSKSGTVDISSTNTTIIGHSTSFFTDYSIGDTIYTNSSYRTVTSITNNTLMDVDSPFGATTTGLTHQKAWIIGDPISFVNNPNRTIVVSGNTATFNLNEAANAAFNVQIAYTIDRSDTTSIKKVLNDTVYVKIDCSNNVSGVKGPYSLGVPDVYKLVGVYADTSGSKTYSTANPDYKSYFTLDNGQRDTHYGLARLTANGNQLAGRLNTSTTLLVELEAFTRDTSQGVGFFNANSYPIDDVNTSNTSTIRSYEIPTYTGSDGIFYDLRNVIDFRPTVANTAAYSNTIVSATINPGSSISFAANPYLPAPDSIFTTDLQYYLARTDRIALDTTGSIIVTEGNPGVDNPPAPPEKTGTMSLALVKVPAYPSLTVNEAKANGRYDIAIQAEPQQIKRYTMKDIGKFDSRIKTLEYYTSLSLLESSAAALQIRSTQTGQTRFQNGIFVDPFNGFDLCNTQHPKFYIAVDQKRSEIRPSFFQWRSDMIFDSEGSSNVQKHGELVMLSHTSDTPYITQSYASKYRNCIEGNIYTWRGTIKLTPGGSMAPDTVNNPDVVNNIDLAQNFINLQQAWGTQWGNWETISTTYANTLITASSSSSQHVGSAPSTLNNTTVYNDTTTNYPSGGR